MTKYIEIIWLTSLGFSQRKNHGKLWYRSENCRKGSKTCQRIKSNMPA